MPRYNTETFIEAAKKIHGDKYDYSQVEYKNIKEKVAIICPEHGLFMQVPEVHLNGSGCRKCGRKKWKDTMVDKYGVPYPLQSKDFVEKAHASKVARFGQAKSPLSGKKRLTKEEFVERARAIHGDAYDYSKVVMGSYDSKLEIICPIHGSFFQTMSKHLQGHGCPHRDCKQAKREQTTLERYGDRNVMHLDSFKERMARSNFEKYGVENAMMSPEVKERLRLSNLEKYGVGCTLELEDVKSQSILTKKENGSYNQSQMENDLYGMLVGHFGVDDVDRWHTSNEYPYACDFHIKSRDMYIELNACFTHGFHWFEPDSEFDQQTLVQWQDRLDAGRMMYAGAIETWVVRDVNKRVAARDKNLNYVVFWDGKLRDADVWFSLGCPDGHDWDGHYTWLPDRDMLTIRRIDVREETHSNLSQVAKFYQQDVFFKTEKALWSDDGVWQNQQIHTRMYLYHNRLKYLGKNPNEITDFELLRGFKISWMTQGYSSFDTALMGEVFDTYGIRSVYDPCAGWGERMLFCKYRDIEYLGIDVNDELRDGYERMMSDLDITKQEIVFADSATVKVNKTCDCVFTCPPYGNQEIYSEHGAENLEHDEFLNWWRQVVENSLQVGPRYFMFQINQRWLDEMSQVVESRGFKKISQLDGKIKASHMNKNTKKEFESVLVFEKI